MNPVFTIYIHNFVEEYSSLETLFFDSLIKLAAAKVGQLNESRRMREPLESNKC